jgi:hypothetical protein
MTTTRGKKQKLDKLISTPAETPVFNNFTLAPYSFFNEGKELTKLDKMFQWTYEDDEDDIYEKLIDFIINGGEQQFSINYIISNYFFRLFLSGTYNNAGIPEILNKLYNYIKEKEEEKGLIGDILLSSSLDIYKQFLRIYLSSLIQYIYNFNQVFISIEKYFQQYKKLNPQMPENIKLYRGFNSNFIQENLLDVLNQIKTGNKNIIIKSVLSTSVNKAVAYRCLNITGNNEGYIWEINVSKDYYEYFKYSFLKKSDKLTQMSEIRNQIDTSENEFVLNYGLQLIYKGFREEYVDLKKINILLFDFYGYDIHHTEDKLDEFNIFITNYINSI